MNCPEISILGRIDPANNIIVGKIIIRRRREISFIFIDEIE
jgi:hypothetical protein